MSDTPTDVAQRTQSAERPAQPDEVDAYRTFAAEILIALQRADHGLLIDELEARVCEAVGDKTCAGIEGDAAALMFEGLVEVSSDQRRLKLTDVGRSFVSAVRLRTRRTEEA